MQFATLNGITLHYALTGDPRRQPLIACANSLGTDLRIWDDVVPRLADRFALLRYDVRGHGLSGIGTPPYSMDEHADDLAALIRHVGAPQAIVCGVSMGGQIALALAARHPRLVGGLVLSDTAHRIGDATFWNTRVAAIQKGGLASIVDPIMERWFSPAFRVPSNAAYAGYRAMFCRQPVAGYIGSCAAVRDADLTAAARGTRVPTLCVVGEQDGSTPPALVRMLADLVPGSAYATIRDAGHLPCIEQPEEFADLVRQFADALAMESRSHVDS
ncbi:MAG TPA: 3-oxoadipate enol-lactonase [Bauldia sp.]|nr:3-oxoadipate enol-lactonase [Bauldia sp.]